MDDIRERNTAFLAVKKHTQNRLGSLGEGGRAERPLKIRNGHVEQGQAKPGPGQQQRGKTGTCFGRQEREPYQGVAYPSPRAPAVTVATTRFFFVLPSAAPEPTTPSSWLGSTQNACLVPRISQVPAYLLHKRKSRPGLSVCTCVRARRPPFQEPLEEGVKLKRTT